MLNHFNNLIKTAIVIVLFILFLSFSALWYFSSGLPDYKKLETYEPPVSSRVYASNGDLIAEYAVEKRLFIPYESIPKTVINAFLLILEVITDSINACGISPKLDSICLVSFGRQ